MLLASANRTLAWQQASIRQVRAGHQQRREGAGGIATGDERRQRILSGALPQPAFAGTPDTLCIGLSEVRLETALDDAVIPAGAGMTEKCRDSALP